MNPLIVALVLVQLHGPGGHRIDINPARVTSIRDPEMMSAGHFGKGVHCLVIMSNGKPIGLMEECDEVRMALGSPGAPKGPCTYVCGAAPERTAK